MEALYMALGGALGALAKAIFTTDAPTLSPGVWRPSRQTVRDVLLGGVVGYLWNLYPVIELPAGATVAQRAVLVGVVGYIGADFLPNVLGQLRVRRGKAVLVLALAPLLGGCSSVPGIIEALAKDPATACVTVTTIYGTARAYRTAIPNGSVSCTQDGMTVRSGGAAATP